MNFYDVATLFNLYKILDSKAITTAILGVGFLFIFSMNLAALTSILITILAIPFSFYMLFVLYQYDKKSWIAGFLIWMGISFIPFFFLTPGNMFLIILRFAPLLFFMLYTMILKEQVGEWLIDLEFEREIKNQKYRKRVT